MHHIEHAVAPASAEVDREHGIAGARQPVERRQVALHEVGDVNVVADAGSVASRVVTSKYAQLRQAAVGNLSQIGHKIAGDAAWIFANDRRWGAHPTGLK